MGFAKFFDQHRPRAMQPGPDGPNRAFQCRRRFLVTQLFELAEDHDLAVVLRQCRHRLAHPSDGLDGREFVPACRGCESAVTVSIAMSAVSTGSPVETSHDRCVLTQIVRIAIESHQPPVLFPALPQVVARDAE